MDDNTKKVLVLHGYGQQVEDVKNKWSRTFKKIGLHNVEYVEGPLSVINRKNEPGHGWFLWSDNEIIYDSKKYHQVNESLSYLNEHIIAHGPYDTIIGYSQGGTILSILLEQFPIAVRKVIIISSFNPLDPEWVINHETKHDVLLVAGQRDEIVPKDSTLSMYVNAQVLIHNGTHSVPNTSDFIKGVKQFLNARK